jgi:glc operon protein GlcG
LFIRQQDRNNGEPVFCSAGQDRPPAVRPGQDAAGAGHTVTSARHAKEVHDAMTQPTGAADPGDLLPAFSVSAALAQRVIGAARETATRLAVPACIAVCDQAGHLVAFERMDGAPLMSAQLAQDKAYSVCAFGGLPTDQWWPMLATEGALLHGIVKTDRLVIFGGGAPIRSGRHLVGAVGVSGGTEEQDSQIANAAASSLFGSGSGEPG